MFQTKKNDNIERSGFLKRDQCQMKISKHIPVNSLHVLKEMPPHDTVNRK